MTKYEGIHPYPHNPEGKIYSKLVDNESVLDEKKLNTQIHKNFLGEKIQIPEELLEYADIKNFNDMFDFRGDKFDYRVYLESLENPFINTNKYELTTLENEDICEILDHLREPIKKSKRSEGQIPYYGANGVTGYIGRHLFDEKLVLIGEDGARWSKGENTAFLIDGKSWVNNHAHVIRTNNNKLIEEYLELIFTRLDFSFLKTRPNGGKLQKGELIKIKFPLPSKETQKKIVSEVSGLNGSNKWKKFDMLLGIKYI